MLVVVGTRIIGCVGAARILLATGHIVAVMAAMASATAMHLIAVAALVVIAVLIGALLRLAAGDE